MPSFASMVSRQLMLLILLFTGVLLAKTGVLKEEGRNALSGLLIKAFMPCALFSAFLVERPSAQLMRSFLLALAFGFALQILLYFVCKYALRRAPEDERPVLQHGILCNNVAYVGMPVVEGFYGAEGLLYLSALFVSFNFFMWGPSTRYFEDKDSRMSLKSMLLQPAMVGLYLGIVFLFTGLQLPLFAEEAVRALGACTTPVSMVIIGGILAGVPVRSVFSRTGWLYCLWRLAIIPLAALGVLLLFGTPAVLAGTIVVTCGMPMAVATAILAHNYGKNPAFASKLIFLSTAASMLTLPLLATLVNHLLG